MATFEQLQDLEIQRKGYLITPTTNLDFSGNTNNYIGVVTYDADPNSITSASIATPTVAIDYGKLMLWQLPIGTHYTSPTLGIEYVKVAMPGVNSTMANCWKKIAFDTSVNGYIDKNIYKAYTVLAATTDSNPLPITLDGADTGIAGSVIGRIGALIQSIPIDSDLVTSVSTSHDTIPSALAVVGYVNNAVAGALTFEGGYNASTDITDKTGAKLISTTGTEIFPTITKGDTYVVTVGGFFYRDSTYPTSGSAGVALGIGDMIIATRAIPSTESATTRTIADWTLVIKSIPTIVSASTTVEGIVYLATVDEVKAGTDTVRAVTPAGLKGAIDQITLIKKYTTTLANPINGAVESPTNLKVTTFTIPASTHLLGNIREISITVLDLINNYTVEVGTAVNPDYSVTINFTVPPVSNQYRVTLIG